VGIAVVFAAAIIVFGMAAVPVETHRTPLRERTGRFQSAGGLLSRMASGAQRGIEVALSRFGRSSSLNALLDSAGVKLAAGEFIILAGAAGLVGVAIGLALFGLIGAGVIGVIALVMPRLIVAHLREKRRTGFGDQLESTLQLLAGSLRAGYGLLQSIATVASEAPSPTKEEFGRVMVETRVGRDLGDSLRALADRMKTDDFGWVTQAIDIQRSVGGDLAEILDTVAQTIRERNQIRRQIRALSAEGRFSAYILIGLPFLVTSFLLLVIPDFLRPLVETTPGRVAVVVAVVLLGVGVVWIRRLIKIVF
jgi:tight adherence protein B